MKKHNCLSGIIFILITVSFFDICLYAQETKNPDPRGKMKPWKEGAWITGKYRNVFLEAGYKHADIDAKLAKAYADVFEGPRKVYFEVGDSMAYVSDVKNHDVRTEGLSYGMMVAVQLNKKDVFDRLWR
jgi:oligosaccharide reducing-end xylanase